jgi:AraC-like DNA-binding protein
MELPNPLARVPRYAHVGWHRQTGGWRLKSHAHPFHELIVVVEGKQTTVIRGKQLAAGPGDVLLYPPLCAHEEWALPGDVLQSYFVAFEWENSPELPAMVRDSHGRIREMARWLATERQDQGERTRDLREALVQALVAEYARLSEQPVHPMVQRVRSFLATRLAEPLTLDDLAEASGLSRFYFLRSYHEHAGTTPMADLRRMRLEAARSLLMTTDLPLKAIAPRIGLKSEFHLSRLFRQELGQSPRDLRRHVAGAR